MSMTRWVLVTSLLTWGSVAQAQPVWKPKPDVALGYSLEIEQAPSQTPASAPRLDRSRAISDTSLVDQRGPARQPEGPGDLVWHYALLIPKADLPKTGKRTKLDVDDRFPVKDGEWRAQGAHTVRRRGKRVAVFRSRVQLSSTVGEAPQSGSLSIERVFSLRRGRLTLARFVLELKQDGKTSRWTGRIRLVEQIRPAKPSFPTRVQEAIKRGVKYLRGSAQERLTSYQRKGPPGQAMGRIALPVLALLRSGVPAKDLGAFFAWLNKLPLRETYGVSLYIMALEACHVQRQALPPRRNSRTVARFARRAVPLPVRDRMARAVRWLIGVRKHGQGWWSYSGQVSLDESPQPLLEGPQQGGGTFVPGKPKPKPEPAQGGPRDHKGGPAARGDHSNTQFAVLALHSALASGVEVPKAVWVEIYEEFRQSQVRSGPQVSLKGTLFGSGSPLLGARPGSPVRVEADHETAVRKKRSEATEGRETLKGRARGWGYGTRSAPGRAYGSMTAGGTSSMAVALEGLRETRQLTSAREAAALRSVRDGLAWHLKNFVLTRNPGKPNRWYYYYLYSLEKAMDTVGVERLGRREWWREVALELLNRQGADGGWGGVNDTSFALLVLNRATLPAKLKIGRVGRVVTDARGGAALWDTVVVSGVGKLSVRRVLAALAEAPADSAKKLRLGQGAWRALDPAIRPRLLPDLSRLLNARHRSTRTWAREVCQKLAGSIDAGEVQQVYRRWQRTERIRVHKDHAGITTLRAALRREREPLCLKRAAVGALTQLQAFEALEDLVAQLDQGPRSYRQEVWANLAALLVGHERPEFDPGAPSAIRRRQLETWRAWCAAQGPALAKAEQARRKARSKAP